MMKIKKIIGGVLLTSALCTGFSSDVAAANIKDYPRLAVMNFGNKAITSYGLRNHDMSSATEYAIYQLSASGWFDLVDYEQLSTIANMHSVNMSGLIDPSTTVQLGKFAGAQFILVGNVTGLTTKENVFDYQHGDKGGIGNAQHVVTANVSLRIVDIETGRIVVAGLGTDSSTSTSTEVTVKKYRNNKIVKESIADTVTRDVINEYSKNNSSNNNETTTYEKGVKLTSNQENNVNNNNNNEVAITKNNNKEDSSSINQNNASSNSNSNSNDKNSSNNTAITKEAVGTSIGDVNGDGYIDKYDAEIVRSKLMQEPVDDNFIFANADVNGDNKITLADYFKILDHVNGKSPLPINKQELAVTGSEESSSVTEGANNSNSSTQEKTDSQSYSKTNSSSDGYSSTNTNGMIEDSKNSLNIDNTESIHVGRDNGNTSDEAIKQANNENRVISTNQDIYYERETLDYTVRIGAVEVSDIQVRNAISKAIRDAIYGKTGILTTLNNGKKLKIKTGF